MLKRFLLMVVFLFVVIDLVRAQAADWTVTEKANYKTIRSLCEHYQDRQYDTSHRKFLFENFIYFENILSDSDTARLQSRLPKFDGFFSLLLHFVDSVGLENLDARPTRYFANSEEYFEPFLPDRELHAALPTCLTYFDRRRPDKPLGTLAFEQNTNRLFSWIVLTQGDYSFFLTFALL